MISNSLGIDFIYGDIHDRSCKKFQLFNIIDPNDLSPMCYLPFQINLISEHSTQFA